jgi:hypothetical protein
VKTIFTTGFSPYYVQLVFEPTMELITYGSIQIGGENAEGDDSLCGSGTKSSTCKSFMCWLVVMLAATMFMLASVLTKHNHHK